MLNRSLAERHPCFAEGRPNNKGRIHLPVSPSCNIACKFCSRVPDEYKEHPGVASKVISPQEAVEVVRKSLELCPDITVAGIAGPGDTLATPHALETFRLVGREFPDIIKCMSTNGLKLPQKADEIIEVGIDTLTVTVNAVDPLILAELCGGIVWQGEYLTGVKAAEILIRNQLEGIQRVTDAGITVKINTVLVPEINGEHIEEIAETVADLGVHIYNLIPLIPRHELAHCKEPDCSQIDAARRVAEQHVQVFRHCQHCRADSIGIPGQSEFRNQVYNKLEAADTFSHG
ncbi:MAG: radical SAM protein [Oscillospiraceae bacterium]|nr:radical SAM protein [Oscillospiraceae bacterium]